MGSRQLHRIERSLSAIQREQDNSVPNFTITLYGGEKIVADAEKAMEIVMGQSEFGDTRVEAVESNTCYEGDAFWAEYLYSFANPAKITR